MNLKSRMLRRTHIGKSLKHQGEHVVCIVLERHSLTQCATRGTCPEGTTSRVRSRELDCELYGVLTRSICLRGEQGEGNEVPKAGIEYACVLRDGCITLLAGVGT